MEVTRAMRTGLFPEWLSLSLREQASCPRVPRICRKQEVPGWEADSGVGFPSLDLGKQTQEMAWGQELSRSPAKNMEPGEMPVE